MGEEIVNTEGNDHVTRHELSLMQRALDERYIAQTRLLDERYETQTKALDAAFVAAKEAVAAALASAEKAVAKQELSTEKRFESVNEFRAQLADQGKTFMPRQEYEAKHEALEKQVDDIADTLHRSEGRDKGTLTQRAQTFASVGIIGTIILVGIAILTFSR